MKYEVAREKVAREACSLSHPTWIWGKLNTSIEETYRDKADQVLAILFTPTQLEEWKVGGKVGVIARDQELPPNLWRHNYREGQESTRKAGFRKVVE